MFKELNGITTLGLKCENTGHDVIDSVWNKWYEDTLNDNILSAIKTNSYEKNYKHVDPSLQKLIGVYPITIDCEPDWKQDFIADLDQWVYQVYTHQRRPGYYGYGTEITTTKLTPWAQEDIDRINQTKNSITNQLNTSSNFVKGYVVDGKREIKILKYIKQQLAKIFTLTDAEIEQMSWYKFYVSHKYSNAQQYLVITNSLASLTGMSSYAPIKNEKGHERVWQSCQKHDGHEEGYARCSWCNLADNGSLLCYVTDGNTVPFCGFEEEPCEYTHQSMQIRHMIRLLTYKDYNRKSSEHHGKNVIVIDRAYPHDMYSAYVFKKVMELCKENNLLFTVHSNYNSGQNTENFDVESLLKIDTAISLYATSSHWIQFAVTGNYGESSYDCSVCHAFRNRMCTNCEPCNTTVCTTCTQDGTNHCTRCSNFDPINCVDCDCDTCDDAPCANREDDDDEDARYTHYDDQCGISSVNSAHEKNDTHYRMLYNIYNPIDLNAECKPPIEIHVGMRVRIIVDAPEGNDSIHIGMMGTVRTIQRNDYGIEFDAEIRGYSLNGNILGNNGYFIHRHSFTPIEEVLPMASNL